MLPAARRPALRIACAVLVAFTAYLGYGIYRRAQVAPPTLTMSVDQWVGFAPWHLAANLGLFEKHGVRVDLVPATDARPGLAAGRIQAHCTTVDSVLLQAAQGVDTRIVLALDGSHGGDGIIAAAAVRTIADLKGRTVAFESLTPSQFLLLTLLRQAGMGARDIHHVDMPAAEAGAAFVAGRVDAAVTWEPWLSKAHERPGGHLLVSTVTTPDLLVDVLVVRRDVLAERSAEVGALCRAWYDAVAAWTRDPGDAARRVAAVFRETPESLLVMQQGVRLYGRAENARFFASADAAPSPAENLVTLAVGVLGESGSLPNDFKPGDVLAPVLPGE